MKILGAVFLSAVALLAAPVGAHEGALDSYGCHPNIAHGSYHCHLGPLRGRQFDAKVDMVRILNETRHLARPKPMLPSDRYVH